MRCCVPHCKSNHNYPKKDRYVSTFQFPKDEERRLLWLKAIGRENLILKKHVVCAKHFEEDDIISHDPYLQKDGTITYILKRGPRLKNNAVPKLFPDPPDQSEENKIQPKSSQSLIDTSNQSEEEAVKSSINCDTKVKEEVFTQEWSTNYLDHENFDIKDEETDSADEIIDYIATQDQQVFEHEYGNWNYITNREVKDEDGNLEETLEKADDDNFLDHSIWAMMDKEENKEATHSDLKKFKCTSCGYASNKKSKLKLHTKSVHLKLKPYKCDWCPYRSVARYKLKRHQDCVHVNLKELKCNFCPFSTNLKWNLKKHLNSVHINWKQFECDYCDFSAARKGGLRSHIEAVHSNLKPYKCGQCEYSANKRIRLKLHMNSVHLNRKLFNCDKCEYAATQKTHLKTHIETVHLKLLNHKCHLCDFASIHRNALKNHIECVHSDSKEYKCELCDYTANLKGKIKSHRDLIHLKYYCDFCDYKAKQKLHVNGHMNSEHSDLINKIKLEKFHI